MSYVPTPSQTVGPFFSIGLSELCRERIECVSADGQRVLIHGRVLDGDGEPVPDAVLEIWQASEAARGGSGPDADARHEKIPHGFGRIATNERGEFQFSTIKPSARRDEDGLMHAPHLAVLLLMRGLLRHLLTRIYFAGDARKVFVGHLFAGRTGNRVFRSVGRSLQLAEEPEVSTITRGNALITVRREKVGPNNET